MMADPQGGGEPMDTSVSEPTDAAPLLNSQGIPDFGEVEVPPPPLAIQSFDGSGPRLMITHIVNENFKSYANVQTLGPFHKSFSSIVGPNGSGKSNVIDSMLFVFGYRANKIRSKKISVLIHKSDQYPDLNSCTVAVHFHKIIDTGAGDDDFDVVPGSQFVVSRTAFKDNSSYYRLGDRKATYKEVATCLRGNGIELDHNRFLILQGEVEQIAMMKPKAATEHEDGMLEFLEDIIGSSRFKQPIEVLASRVEELSELRGEKLNRVKVVEKEKDDLEGVKNEAMQFLQMENEIVGKKNELYQKYLSECQENYDKAVAKRDVVNEKVEEMSKGFKELEESKKEKGKSHKKIWNQYEGLNKKCEEMREKFSQFEQEDVRVREGLKHSKGKGKKLEKTIEQERKKLEELQLIPEKSEKDVTELNKKLEKLEREKKKEEEKLAEVMESLKTETQGLQEEKDAKEQELLAMQKQLNETKSTYKVAQSELDLYLSNLTSEKAKLEETERNLTRTTATLKDRHSGIKDMEKRLPDIEKAMEKAKQDHQQTVKKETELNEKVRSARVRLEESRSSLQSSRGKSKLVEALVALKRAGRLPGVYGRLGDLGAIDDKYDVAISTACGALDNIVVDNMETGQQCIEFLRKNNLGVATFILLDKQAKLRDAANRRIQTPENVPRLFDLVQMKEDALKPAFYFALRDTLVAKDLDQATRIAYGRQRYRVVTLGGQLIETSGTMAGGGTRVSKGRMGSQVLEDVDPKQLEKLEGQLEQDSAELSRCRETKNVLEDTVEKLSKQGKELRHGLDKFRLEVSALEDQNKALKQQLVDQKEKVKQAAPDEKELKQLEKKVEGFKKEFEKAQGKASKKEDEIHDLHKEIMNIGGSKLKAAESRLNMIQTQIDQITGHVTKAKVAVKTAQRNAKKTEDKIESMEKEIEEAKESVEKLEKEFKELEENATTIMQEHKKAQESIKEVEVELKGVQAEMAKIEEEEKTMQKEQIEIKHELEKFDTVVKDNALKIKHWKKEVPKLSLHVIEEQEERGTTLATLTEEQLAGINTKDTQFAITVLEEQLAQMKPNMAAIAEYRKKEEQYLRRVGELDHITDVRERQRRQLDGLRKQRLDDFMAGFNVITNKLKEMYQMITLGGDAELELVDSLDPFSEGIAFSVRPPKKSWKNISNLSGGEKTLSSLALVFALHHYKPTPLYVMDEIDAALDFKNVSIIANYIKERTKNAQFIIISLRNNMFELADRLIGIYKTYNCTKCVPVDPRKITLPLSSKDLNSRALNTTSSVSSSSSSSAALPNSGAKTAQEVVAPNSPANLEVPVGS